MEFFDKIFDWLTELSAKVPSFDFGGFFIAVTVALALLGIIIGFTYLGTSAYKLRRASLKILKYLNDEASIDDDNLGDFTAQCFSSSAPRMLRESWVKYLGVRFGYPSDIVSEADVFDREVKKAGNIRANVFIGVALVVLAVSAFLGFGSLSGYGMSVVHCTGLLLSGVIYLILSIIGKSQFKKAKQAFNDMQEELDAKVDFQVENNYSTETSPLVELSAIVDGIIAKNTAKFVEIADEMNETPSVAPQIEEVRPEGGAYIKTRFDDENIDELESVDAYAEDIEETAEDAATDETETAERSDETVEADETVERVETKIADGTVVTDEETPNGSEEINEAQEEKTDMTASGESEAETLEVTARETEETLLDKESDGNTEPCENIDEAAAVTAEYAQEPAEEPEDRQPEPSEDENAEILEDDKNETIMSSKPAEAEDLIFEEDETDEQPPETNVALEMEDASDEIDEYTDIDGEEVTVAAEAAFEEKDDADRSAPVEIEQGFGEEVSEEEIENQSEDESEMFGRKKREAAAVAEEPVKKVDDEFVEGELIDDYYDSEILDEAEGSATEQSAAQETANAEEVSETEAEQIIETEASEEETADAEPIEEESAEEEQVEDTAETVGEDEPIEADEEEPEEEEAITPASENEAEPEVVYIVDEEEEDETAIKPPKLAKLPHLLDYMLTLNISKSNKIKLATLLLSAYNFYKKDPANKEIVLQCLFKIMGNLQNRG